MNGSKIKISIYRLVAILDYANYQNCPNMPYGQPSLIGSRSIQEDKSIKIVHRKEHFYVQEMTTGLL